MSFTKSQTLFGSHYEFQHSGQPWKHVKTLEKVKYTCIISLQKLLEFTQFTARYKTNWLTQILLWNPSTSTRIHKYTACFIAGWFFNCQNIADYGWQVWQYQSASCAVTSIRKSQHITCTPQKKKILWGFFQTEKAFLCEEGEQTQTLKSPIYWFALNRYFQITRWYPQYSLKNMKFKINCNF